MVHDVLLLVRHVWWACPRVHRCLTTSPDGSRRTRTPWTTLSSTSSRRVRTLCWWRSSPTTPDSPVVALLTPVAAARVSTGGATLCLDELPTLRELYQSLESSQRIDSGIRMTSRYNDVRSELCWVLSGRSSPTPVRWLMAVHDRPHL